MSLFDDSRPGSDAVLSRDGLYRYRLDRAWADGPAMVWLMLNPSTADAFADDPTIRKCVGFSRREPGVGALTVVNLYGIRATDPRELGRNLTAGDDIVGPDNDHHITQAVDQAVADDTIVVLAFGRRPPGLNREYHLARIAAVVEHIGALTTEVYCLGYTQPDRGPGRGAAFPRHPLMLGYSTPLERFDPTRLVL